MQSGDFGQPALEALVEELLDRGRIEGSFLFDGPPGSGKEAFAVDLGRILNCESKTPCAPRDEFRRGPEGRGPRCGSCRKFDALQHPDLVLLFPVPRDTWPDGKTVAPILAEKARNPYHEPEFDRPIGIQAETLRDVVVAAVQRRPVEGRLRTIVISNADRMAPNVGNLLLKTLEEPPADTLLVLTTSVAQKLLPTIQSRCQRLRFAPLDPAWMIPRLQALYGATPAQARLAAAVSQGSMLAAARFVRGDLEEIRDRAFDVLLHAAAGDMLELLQVAQKVAPENTQRRHYLPLFLQMTAAVARDALLVAQEPAATRRGAEPGATPLVNADRAADLQKLARAMDAEALAAAVRRAGETEQQLAGNAHVEQALVACFLDLLRPQTAAGRR